MSEKETGMKGNETGMSENESGGGGLCIVILIVLIACGIFAVNRYNASKDKKSRQQQCDEIVNLAKSNHFEQVLPSYTKIKGELENGDEKSKEMLKELSKQLRAAYSSMMRATNPTSLNQNQLELLGKIIATIGSENLAVEFNAFNQKAVDARNRIKRVREQGKILVKLEIQPDTYQPPEELINTLYSDIISIFTKHYPPLNFVKTAEEPYGTITIKARLGFSTEKMIMRTPKGTAAILTDNKFVTVKYLETVLIGVTCSGRIEKVKSRIVRPIIARSNFSNIRRPKFDKIDDKTSLLTSYNYFRRMLEESRFHRHVDLDPQKVIEDVEKGSSTPETK